MDERLISENTDLADVDENIYCDLFSCETIYDASKAVSSMRSSGLLSVCFIASGAGIHRVLDRDIPCQKGDVCIIAPNVAHRFFLADKSGSLTVRQIQFDISSWFWGEVADKERADYCYGVFNENAFIAYATLNSYMQDRIYTLFDYIECEMMERKKGWQELVHGYLANLFINIGRYVDSAIKNVSFASFKEWDIVSAAISTIRENYSSSSLTLDSIAATTYVSKPQLSKLFKKVTGENFSDYLRGVRIKHVCEMLENSELNVDDIARSCGFHNMASFYKAFGAVKNMTPNEYRISRLCAEDNADKYEDEYKKLLKGEKIMSILNEISENLQKGKAKIVKELVQQALDEGVKPADILDQGLLAGMNVVGEKFKNNEVYVPEVLVAARAMNMGSQILKPHLAEAGVMATGRVCIGTVQGDLHDIGKNLVKMMMEGKGLEVVDLGTDVSPEAFVNAAIEQNCQVICCSALLTTTMGVMADVVKAAEAAGIRDKVKIMIGGAPISQEYCDKIGADCYTVDAASAADAAVAFCK